MRKRIDAHVHITPATALGKKNPRFDTENLPYGRLRMGDGGFYTMPCYIHDSQFTADTLVNMMDVYGVEKAVIMQSLMSPQNEDVARAVERWPERLVGAMVIEPVGDWRAEMAAWQRRGLRVIKFEMRAYTDPNCYPDLRYDDETMTALFDEAQQLGLTITVDPAPVDFPVYGPDAFATAVRRHPDAHFVLCHLGYPLPVDTPECYRRWQAMVDAANQPNCWVDVSAMPDFFDAEGWPYPTAHKLLAEVKAKLGAQKLIWGTDITGTLNRATYPQMIEMFERSGVLTDRELDALFYDNAAAAYQL